MYLYNYAEAHALVLPGRIPGYQATCVQHYRYNDICTTSISKSVAYSTFTQLWRSLTPSIIVMKPASDLCWLCQQHVAAVLKAANMSENKKSDVLLKYEEHLRIVGVERSFYRTASNILKKTSKITLPPTVTRVEMLSHAHEIYL